VITTGGISLPAQPVEGGLLVHDPTRQVPGLGMIGLQVGAGHTVPAPPTAAVRAGRRDRGALLENELLSVEIGADGTLQRVVDRAAGEREVLAERGNQLWIFVDKPRTYDAWDIEENYEDEGEEIAGVTGIEIVESGPLRGAVRVSRTWRDSRIVQTYRLLSGSRRLDVVTDVDWRERQRYVQARFPLAVHAHEATFETMYGVMRRPTHRNTSWDAARFEVSGHRFADLSEAGYGVALLTNSKYGYSAHGNLLTLSLLRGTLYPDPGADLGEHHFTYSLFPHHEDWTQANVVAEAFALNSPLIAVAGQVDVSPIASEPFVARDGLPLALGSLKRPEDDGPGVILRLYEPHGARGRATLRFPASVRRVARVNLLEEDVAGAAPTITAEGRAVALEVRPFEVITLRVDLERAREESATR
jgi:alpha-mannosidase